MTNNLSNKYRKTLLLLVCVSFLILVPSFLLLIASSWNSDDYFIAKVYQINGISGLSERIFTWSPRFFSEIILYVYYNIVPWLGKPFTGGMIFITWLFLLSSIFIFTRNTIQENSLFLQNKKQNLVSGNTDTKKANISLKILLPLLLILIFFLYLLNSQIPNAMFYLVVVSTAYVSTLAGIIFNLNFFINKSSSQNITVTNLSSFIVFGTITSSSWEMGAIYQLFVSAFIFILLLLNSLLNKFNYLPFSALDKFNRWKLWIGNLIPFSLSLYVLFLLQSNRVGSVEANNIESSLTGNFKDSLSITFIQFFKEQFFLNNPTGETQTDFYSFTYSIAYKLGFLILITILFYQAKVKLNKITTNACLLSILPLLITNFIITFSAYYQLGINTYDRQNSFKSALIGLIILLIALITASLLSSKETKIKNKINIYWLLNLPITLLITFFFTLTLLVNLQFNNLKKDLVNFHDFVLSNTHNWQVSFNDDKSFIAYIQVPSFYIFRMYLEPGVYPSCDKLDNEKATRYLSYFDKQKLYASSLETLTINNKLRETAKEIKSLENKIHFSCFFPFMNPFGNVEQISGITHSGQIIEININDTVEILGWAINPDKTRAKRIIITVENEENFLVHIPLDISRADVAQYFENENLINSGWKAKLTPSPDWDGQTLNFKVWTYDPDTKIANFNQDFVLNFSANK